MCRNCHRCDRFAVDVSACGCVIRTNVRKPYSLPLMAFACCVGCGSETCAAVISDGRSSSLICTERLLQTTLKHTRPHGGV